MKLHELQPSEGSRHTRHRVGRGEVGWGKLSNVDKKVKSRSGGGVRLGFKVDKHHCSVDSKTWFYKHQP